MNCSITAQQFAESAKGATVNVSNFERANKSLSLSSRAAVFGMKALSVAMNVGIMLAVTEGLRLLATWIDNVIHAEEKAREKLEELKSSYTSNANELKNVNSELETAAKRLEELNKIPNKTFVEQEELDKLVLQNDELERQKSLLEAVQKVKNQELNRQFAATFATDMENKNEYQLVNGSVMPHSTVADAIFGAEYDSLVTEKEYVDYQFKKYEELMGQKAQHEKDLLSAVQLGDSSAQSRIKDAKDKIDGEIDEIKQYLAKKVEQLNNDKKDIQYINSPTTEDERNVNKALDYIENLNDRFKIAINGEGEKTTAFNRIFDSKQFVEAKKELEELSNQGRLTANSLSNSKYNELVGALNQVGISAEEAARQINSVHQPASQIASTVPQLTPLKDIFKDLTSSASLLSQAWNEMNDNGELSVSTVLALMEADAQWTAVLEVVNGKLIINKDLFVESCKAKVRAKIEEAKQVIAASQKEIQAIIAENKALMSGAAGLSGKTWVEDQIRPLQQSTKEAEANLKALEAVLNSLSGDKPFDGITGSAKNASSAINELKTALSSAKSAIDNLLSMTISMIKQDYADQREALQEQLDGIRDKYEAEKEGIEEVQKAQKKANDDAKKALQDQLDGYRKIIQAQIDLLREKENQHDYERGLNEKQSDVGKIQNQLDARQNDDSAEAKAKRLELMDELQKKQDELAEYQHDHSIEIQEDALNKELKAYEDKMQSQMDALDEEADRMEEIHRQRLDQIEAQYKAETERIQREIEDNERAANNETAVRAQAIALIEGRSGEFYNRLLEKPTAPLV